MKDNTLTCNEYDLLSVAALHISPALRAAMSKHEQSCSCHRHKASSMLGVPVTPILEEQAQAIIERLGGN